MLTKDIGVWHFLAIKFITLGQWMTHPSSPATELVYSHHPIKPWTKHKCLNCFKCYIKKMNYLVTHFKKKSNNCLPLTSINNSKSELIPFSYHKRSSWAIWRNKGSYHKQVVPSWKKIRLIVNNVDSNHNLSMPTEHLHYRCCLFLTIVIKHIWGNSCI